MARLSEMSRGQCPCTQHSVSGIWPLALSVTSQTAQDTYPFLKPQLRCCSRDSFLSHLPSHLLPRVLASCVLALSLPYSSLLEHSNCPATKLKDWVSLLFTFGTKWLFGTSATAPVHSVHPGVVRGTEILSDSPCSGHSLGLER